MFRIVSGAAVDRRPVGIIHTTLPAALYTVTSLTLATVVLLSAGSVCLFVCLFVYLSVVWMSVSKITLEPLEISSRNF